MNWYKCSFQTVTIFSGVTKVPKYKKIPLYLSSSYIQCFLSINKEDYPKSTYYNENNHDI